MHVPRAQLGHGQKIRGQDATIGHHHENIGPEPRKQLGQHAVPHLERLLHRQSQPQGQLLHRRRVQSIAPPCRPVRLAHHCHNLVFASHRF